MAATVKARSRKLALNKARLNRLLTELEELCIDAVDDDVLVGQLELTEALFRETDALQADRANLPVETKHPMLLPHGDEVVEMIIWHVHERQLHAGVNQALAASWQRYWITRGRSAVKNVVRQCGTCWRSTGRPYEPKMGELLAERVTPSGPYQYVGVNFAVPILARSGNMVVRAIHLELVMDITMDSFLGALRRFISRRGRPKLI
ncbi:hypothetical protein T07_5094 [Trichinella nelsoni]|uniref:Integrase zinc-binding domain-containing protein n=1 Tax=Trichinella nelsoni TaxID=6336 RepID=A0A0V0RHK5_9BILA|nr:hypothetical protein T07_5094 [Trichinella nelsoni]